MKNLFLNIRFRFLVFSAVLSVGIYFYTIYQDYKNSFAQNLFHLSPPIIAKLTTTYALVAVAYLYFALLAAPFCKTFTFLQFRGQYMKARRALGVSAFYFSVLHSSLAFFGLLGGFAGLSYLDEKYLIAISLSFTALVILALMAATSFDFIIEKMTFERWKLLHRFVYFASILIVIHTLLLGPHFSNLSNTIPQIFFLALAFYLILQALHFDHVIETKFPFVPHFGISFIAVSVFLYLFFINSFYSEENGKILGFDIHAQHILLAKQAQQTSLQPSATPAIPALVGDRTKRFSVSFGMPDDISANTDIPLQFHVTDASSGFPVELYRINYEKIAHLIVVDSSLSYFAHIHPTQKGSGFEITTQFPQDGVYHLYIDFVPYGAIEQQFGTVVKVGQAQASPSAQIVDTKLTKTFGNYEVTLKIPSTFSANEMSVGGQKLTFVIQDAQTHKPITTLKPYLASFGHLVMVNQKTYDYLHVHPTNLVTPPPNAIGGPEVEFIPLGIYGPIKPGVYRVFAQFNPNGELIVADFTIKIVE